MNYIVYIEFIDRENHSIERYYYGTWNSKDRANEVALSLGSDFSAGIFHCVCREDEAEGFGIRNMRN